MQLISTLISIDLTLISNFVFFLVGIRCKFCKGDGVSKVAAISYPVSISGIYESVKRLSKLHLHDCIHIPNNIKQTMNLLHNGNNSSTTTINNGSMNNSTTNWKIPTTRQYWIDSARELGMIDTSDGIRFEKDPFATAKILFHNNSNDNNNVQGIIIPSSPIINTSNDKVNTILTTITTTNKQENNNNQQEEDKSLLLVTPSDEKDIPKYVYYLIQQVQKCYFTENDRFIARSKATKGYPGFQCKYCSGHAGLGKYFPTSSKSLSTNSTSQNIHGHLMKCRKCPDNVKEKLEYLKNEKQQQQTSGNNNNKKNLLVPGWRRNFFDKVWSRLHDKLK